MKLAKVSTSHIQAVTGTTFVATLSSLLFGYATAVIAGVVGAIEHNFIAPRELSNTAADALLGPDGVFGAGRHDHWSADRATHGRVVRPQAPHDPRRRHVPRVRGGVRLSGNRRR